MFERVPRRRDGRVKRLTCAHLAPVMAGGPRAFLVAREPRTASKPRAIQAIAACFGRFDNQDNGGGVDA